MLVTANPGTQTPRSQSPHVNQRVAHVQTHPGSARGVQGEQSARNACSPGAYSQYKQWVSGGRPGYTSPRPPSPSMYIMPDETRGGRMSPRVQMPTANYVLYQQGVLMNQRPPSPRHFQSESPQAIFPGPHTSLPRPQEVQQLLAGGIVGIHNGARQQQQTQQRAMYAVQAELSQPTQPQPPLRQQVQHQPSFSQSSPYTLMHTDGQQQVFVCTKSPRKMRQGTDGFVVLTSQEPKLVSYGGNAPPPQQWAPAKLLAR